MKFKNLRAYLRDKEIIKRVVSLENLFLHSSLRHAKKYCICSAPRFFLFVYQILIIELTQSLHGPGESEENVHVHASYTLFKHILKVLSVHSYEEMCWLER